MLFLIPPPCLPPSHCPTPPSPSHLPPSPPPPTTRDSDFLTDCLLYHPTIYMFHYHLNLPSLINFHILLFFQPSLCLMLVQSTTHGLY